MAAYLEIARLKMGDVRGLSQERTILSWDPNNPITRDIDLEVNE